MDPGSDTAPQRMLFIGGPWHGESRVVTPRAVLRVENLPERSLQIPPRDEPICMRYAEIVDYRRERWITSAGEELQFYAVGERRYLEGLFWPISSTFDQLGRPLPVKFDRNGVWIPDPLYTGFGPNRLFLAAGLWNAFLIFDDRIEAIGRRHRILRNKLR